MFLSSVNEEAVKHFTIAGPKSLFDNKKIYNKEKAPVMLDFLPNARTFLLQQSKPLQIKKCSFHKIEFYVALNASIVRNFVIT